MKNLPNEKWKWILGYKGFYKVSNMGRVYCVGFSYKKIVKFTDKNGVKIVKTVSYTKERGLVRTHSKEGYTSVCLSCKEHKRRLVKISTLVLESFVGPRPKGMECRHLNDVKGDNRLENLAWGTHGDNMKDIFKNGIRSMEGENNPMYGADRSGEKNPMYGVRRYGEKNPNYRHGLRCSVN